MTPKVWVGQLGGWQCHPLGLFLTYLLSPVREETLGEDRFHLEMKKLKPERWSDKETGVLRNQSFASTVKNKTRTRFLRAAVVQGCIGLQPRVWVRQMWELMFLLVILLPQ